MRSSSLIVALLVVQVWAVAPAPGSAADAYGPYAAEVVRVIDGDTVELDVALWPGLVQRIHLRLDGVDTPESRGAPLCEKILAQRDTEFTRRFLNRYGLLAARSEKHGEPRNDEFFRATLSGVCGERAGLPERTRR